MPPRAAPAVSVQEIPVYPVPSALARRFAQICVTAIAEAIDGSGLTPLQYAVLRHIDYEGATYQGGLAGRLGIDQSNASILVEQLVSAGLIDRQVDGADRRARFLRLTKEGNKLVRRLRPKTMAANHRLLGVLQPAEREVFLDLLIRVVEGNRELDRPGAGRRKRTVRSVPATAG
jgi:DNA-binding MarR family transcriptional regulator